MGCNIIPRLPETDSVKDYSYGGGVPIGRGVSVLWRIESLLGYESQSVSFEGLLALSLLGERMR